MYRTFGALEPDHFRTVPKRGPRRIQQAARSTIIPLTHAYGEAIRSWGDRVP